MIDFVFYAGVIAILLLASVAARYDLLSEGGIAAALLVGLTIFWFGGWEWFLLLAAFFVIASVFTKFKAKNRLKKIAMQESAKGGVRDFWQVGANGALGALIAVIYHFFPLNTFYFAYVGVIATVTADTLATEIGVLSKRAFFLTTFQKAKSGLSGAVSFKGLAVSLLASVLIGLSALVINAFFNFTAIDNFNLVLIPTVAGFFGALIDSLLGATIQAKFYCKKCRKITERETHKCGIKTVYRTGWKSVNNDTVNLLASISGAVIAALLYHLLKGF
ncbi:DUF92 domain-containing protein [Candidatus Micrarchaeota archaeon]|nr:DUF92 domain-containing protein [Candidatus Micrarchaeota archaeon]